MKTTAPAGGDFRIKQEGWSESPCSLCNGTPCCRNLPLTSCTLDSRRDFISLLLVSSYRDIYPALKDSGEWIIYLGRNCSFHDPISGKCGIHGAPDQSMVCKSYDAHSCWYIDAFRGDSSRTMIPFTTNMLVWFEKTYSLIDNHFDCGCDWDELCCRAVGREAGPQKQAELPVPPESRMLSFEESRNEEFLFFPPFRRPERRSHLDLLLFRLGFPGVSLAVSDSCWAFLVRDSIDPEALGLIRNEYYPGINPGDGAFSFDSIRREQNPWSSSGEEWLVLERDELYAITALCSFSPDGRITEYPDIREIQDILSL